MSSCRDSLYIFVRSFVFLFGTAALFFVRLTMTFKDMLSYVRLLFVKWWLPTRRLSSPTWWSEKKTERCCTCLASQLEAHSITGTSVRYRMVAIERALSWQACHLVSPFDLSSNFQVSTVVRLNTCLLRTTYIPPMATSPITPYRTSLTLLICLRLYLSDLLFRDSYCSRFNKGRSFLQSCPWNTHPPLSLW